MKYDLIVIGSGPGGYEAAAHAGKLGKKVLLFEKGELGGTCLNTGCIPTKSLLKSARTLALCRDAHSYGVSIEAARPDFPSMQKRKQQIIVSLRKGVAALLKASCVEVVHKEAVIRSAGTVIADGRKYQADNILIATGSIPATPPIKGIESAAVLDSTGILNLQEIPESLAIIGGGVIGLEFACLFSELGSKVTVIEVLPAIGSELDADMSDLLLKTLKRTKIEFLLSAAVTSISTKCLKCRTAEGKEISIRAECILNATGRRPFVEKIADGKVGLELSNGAIQTDTTGKTNVPGIWACGDVTGRMFLAHSATREGMVAVNNMFERPDVMRFEYVPSVIYTHPEVACVGRTEEQLKTAGIEFAKKVVPMAMSGRYVIETNRERGTVKVLTAPGHGEILGIHMIGDTCSEFVATAVTIMEAELRVKDVAELVFPHPTISEVLKFAICPTTRTDFARR